MGVDVRMGLISWLQLQRGVGNWLNGAKNARSRRELNRGPLSVLSNLLTGWQGFWTPLQRINLGPPHVVRKLLLKKKKELLKEVYCDVSQNPMYRAFTNNKNIAPCLCKSTSLYSFGQDRFLLPFEHLLLQGHRRSLEIPSAIRSNQLSHLAGEGMCLPCLGLVVWSLYLTKGLP